MSLFGDRNVWVYSDPDNMTPLLRYELIPETTPAEIEVAIAWSILLMTAEVVKEITLEEFLKECEL